MVMKNRGDLGNELFPRSSRSNRLQPTLQLDFSGIRPQRAENSITSSWMSDLQNYELINGCCVKALQYGNLLYSCRKLILVKLSKVSQIVSSKIKI